MNGFLSGGVIIQEHWSQLKWTDTIETTGAIFLGIELRLLVIYIGSQMHKKLDHFGKSNRCVPSAAYRDLGEREWIVLDLIELTQRGMYSHARPPNTHPCAHKLMDTFYINE